MGDLSEGDDLDVGSRFDAPNGPGEVGSRLPGEGSLITARHGIPMVIDGRSSATWLCDENLD